MNEENEEIEEVGAEDFGEDKDGYPKKMPYESWVERYGIREE